MQDYPLSLHWKKRLHFTPDTPSGPLVPKTRQGSSEPRQTWLLGLSRRGWSCWCGLRKHWGGAFSGSCVISEGRAQLSSQEIENIFHTLNRDVSKSWGFRDRSIKMKMPLHPQLKREKNIPIRVQMLAQCPVHCLHLRTQRMLVGWRMDRWVDEKNGRKN
uniref:Uncharacterized protein n=1 Tax=Molossus molossus TaxID=27622 RepID=A0A7J8DBQ0_MOLMO|nr:hypothetical protein HJG59_009373 [Molossus molossus]